MASSFLKSPEDKADSISASWCCSSCKTFKTFSQLVCNTPNIIEGDVPASLLVDLKPGPMKDETSSEVARARADESKNGK